MAKFYGKIGYSESKEIRPGVWKAETTERPYFGELLRLNRRMDSGDSVNSGITLNNEISIIADEYALNNFFNMKYVVFKGVKWKITNVEVKTPRLILSVGGVYNGE